jgi:hypothetical protein
LPGFTLRRLAPSRRALIAALSRRTFGPPTIPAARGHCQPHDYQRGYATYEIPQRKDDQIQQAVFPLRWYQRQCSGGLGSQAIACAASAHFIERHVSFYSQTPSMTSNDPGS